MHFINELQLCIDLRWQQLALDRGIKRSNAWRPQHQGRRVRVGPGSSKGMESRCSALAQPICRPTRPADFDLASRPSQEVRHSGGSPESSPTSNPIDARPGQSRQAADSHAPDTVDWIRRVDVLVEAVLETRHEHRAAMDRQHLLHGRHCRFSGELTHRHLAKARPVEPVKRDRRPLSRLGARSRQPAEPGHLVHCPADRQSSRDLDESHATSLPTRAITMACALLVGSLDRERHAMNTYTLALPAEFPCWR